MLNIRRLALLLGALLPAALGAPAAPNNEPAAVAGKFIITLKESAGSPMDAHLEWVESIRRQSQSKHNTAGVEKTYKINTWNAYAGEFDSQTIEKIKRSPDVANVSPDYIMHLADVVEDKRTLITQSNASWGLASISHHSPSFNTYVYDSSAGTGGFAYVVDTGILTTHSQFENRASLGYSAVVGPHVDLVGHGTHVAGIIAGKTYGVAKNCQVISVKVFQGISANTSVILDGYNWAVNDIVSKGRASRSVVNLSLGGPASPVWKPALDAAFSQGVLTVVAAGNGDPMTGPLPVSSQSPANVPNAITVAAMDSFWKTASFTNYGDGVDTFAAGVGIVSAWIGSNIDVRILDGTSMATPFVSGLAIYLQVLENINSPSAVTARIKSLGTSGKITGNLNGSPNLSAYNGAT